MLEDRNLLAITVGFGDNVNVSKLNDNQAEATIAINPTNPQAVFTASMTFHGSAEGKFDPNVNVLNVFKDHTPGLFAAYGNNIGGGWSSRIMLTGGPTEASQVERSLPSATGDPQAAFDDYGNLYLTYLSATHQFGNATGGGGNTLTDTSRQWVPNMWAGRILTIRPGVPGVGGEENAIILSNTADTLTITQNWNTPPAAGNAYVIRSGAFAPGQPFLPGNAAVVLLSTNDGQSFQFLKILDSGAPTPTTRSIDYPAIATGPGRNENEKSVWLAWRGSNNKIMATGAPVTARGAIGTFIANEEVIGSTGRGLPRLAVGPNGQVMVAFTGVAGAGDTTVPIYTNVDDDGLGNNGFRATAKHVADTTVLVNPNPPFTIIDAQPNRGITPQVNLAWDRSGNYVAAPNGLVYLTYTYSFGGGDTDIAWTTSDNSGTAWSPWQVLFPNANSQFLPSVAVDQTNGDVTVVWLDARDDPANVKVKLYGTVSGDGGATWEGLAGPYPIAQGQSDATRTNLPQRGNSTGGNTTTTLNDTNQNWTPNNYWRSNFGADVPSVGGLIPVTITASTATQLTVDPAWGAAPGEGAEYTITPLYKFDYGEYTGVAFYNGVFYAVWPDNSNSTNDNPNGTRGWLDLYTVRGTVTHVTTGQWASHVIGFSTEWSPGDWSAAQALGPPDTFTYGDVPTAWSPLPQNGSVEYLTLGFETPVHAIGVIIRETNGNGFVSQVDLLDVNDQPQTIWTGTDPSQPGSPAEFGLTFPATSYLVKGVKIYVDTDHDLEAWEQIDAVMLLGEADGGGLATITQLSPNFGPSSGGSTVILTGTDFVDVTAVSFGGTAAAFTVDSSTQITAIAPAQAAGTVEVTVTTAGGSSPPTSAAWFTYVPEAFRTDPGFSATSFGPDDDGSVGPVALGFTLDFFGAVAAEVYVNNNGNVTLFAPEGEYTPYPLDTAGQPIIAAFFADVDTRVGPVVSYGTGTVDGRAAFAVNWIAVGYFTEHLDKINVFQLVLIDRSDVAAGAFDIEFNYGRVEWETGDFSGGVEGLGGTSARAGYGNGSGDPGTFFELDGSGVNGAFLDSNPSTGLIHHSLNSGVLGRYVFEVRGGGGAAAFSGGGGSTAGAASAVPVGGGVKPVAGSPAGGSDGLAAPSEALAPAPGTSGVRVFSVKRPNRGPFAALQASGPVSLGTAVTFLFSNQQDHSRPVPASSFRYSFDFNNDGDFADAGEVRDGTSPSAPYTFTRRGWHVVRGRIRAADGRFTDFWLRLFVL